MRAGPGAEPVRATQSRRRQSFEESRRVGRRFRVVPQFRRPGRFVEAIEQNEPVALAADGDCGDRWQQRGHLCTGGAERAPPVARVLLAARRRRGRMWRPSLGYESAVVQPPDHHRARLRGGIDAGDQVPCHGALLFLRLRRQDYAIPTHRACGVRVDHLIPAVAAQHAGDIRDRVEQRRRREGAAGSR